MFSKDTKILVLIKFGGGIAKHKYKYKNGLIKTLLDRCYKRWNGFDNDVENLTKILNKNQFPTKLIN